MKELYKVDANGKIRLWRITPNDDGYLVIETGLVDGMLVETIVDVFENNSGRNLDEQIELETKSRISKQLRLGYCTSKSLAKSAPKFIAMKGYRYQDNKQYVKFPCIVQPKLDGLRCTVHKVDDSTLEFWSYGRVQYTSLTHLEEQLINQMDVGDVLDGELYVHGVKLQTLNSWVRRKQKLTQRIQYHVFDKVDTSAGYFTRQQNIQVTSHIKVVQSQTAHSHKEIELFRQHFVKLGYEGIMVRNINTPYEFKRSRNILKYKMFYDAEYRIVDVIAPESGEDVNCAILVCETQDGKQFKSVPKGTKAYRRKVYKNKEDYIGLEATIRYAGLSNDGVPVPNPVTTYIHI